LFSGVWFQVSIVGGQPVAELDVADALAVATTRNALRPKVAVNRGVGTREPQRMWAVGA
jgi:hypothetical protein